MELSVISLRTWPAQADMQNPSLSPSYFLIRSLIASPRRLIERQKRVMPVPGAIIISGYERK